VGLRNSGLLIRSLVLITVLISLETLSAHAQNTIHVPAEITTIQGAIDIANTGDTVLVAPGSYAENIDFKGKAITVASEGGASATVLDGSGVAPVVRFGSGETGNSILQGFTIQNGQATEQTA
jgi:hypothetical protein